MAHRSSWVEVSVRRIGFPFDTHDCWDDLDSLWFVGDSPYDWNRPKISGRFNMEPLRSVYLVDMRANEDSFVVYGSVNN